MMGIAKWSMIIIHAGGNHTNNAHAGSRASPHAACAITTRTCTVMRLPVRTCTHIACCSNAHQGVPLEVLGMHLGARNQCQVCQVCAMPSGALHSYSLLCSCCIGMSQGSWCDQHLSHTSSARASFHCPQHPLPHTIAPPTPQLRHLERRPCAGSPPSCPHDAAVAHAVHGQWRTQ